MLFVGYWKHRMPCIGQIPRIKWIYSNALSKIYRMIYIEWTENDAFIQSNQTENIEWKSLKLTTMKYNAWTIHNIKCLVKMNAMLFIE